MVVIDLTIELVRSLGKSRYSLLRSAWLTIACSKCSDSRSEFFFIIIFFPHLFFARALVFERLEQVRLEKYRGTPLYKRTPG